MDEDETTEISRGRVVEILNKVSSEASNHGSNYACGMRNARSIVESELKAEFRDDEPTDNEHDETDPEEDSE